MNAAAAAAAAALAALSFQVKEGGNVNLFYQSDANAYHLRLSDPKNPRILFAFPAGNSGALLSFDPSLPENAGLAWTASSWTAWDGPDGIRGGQAELAADRPKLVLTGAILDSVRLIRDFPLYPKHVADRRKLGEALGLDSIGWNEARASASGSTLTFVRRTLDGKNHYRAELAFQDGAVIKDLENGRWSVASRDGKPLKLRLSAGVDYAPLTPLSPERLLAPLALAAYRESAPDSPVRRSFDHLRFLTYREKMLAGSHRYLTYFGRDTMITALLAWDELTPEAREAELRAVLDRLSPDGIVAHEEDIGGQAELDHVTRALELLGQGDKGGARRALEDSQAPSYDYRMVDGEPLLALLAHRYLTDPDTSPERREAVLSAASAQGVPYRDLLARALRRLAEEAGPYARSPKPTNLIALRFDFGDWRDSNAGNGFGRYAGSVDAYLAPLALSRLAETAKAAGIDPASLGGEPLERLSRAWSGAQAAFEVSLSAGQARKRLRNFLASVPPDERRYYETRLGPLEKIGPVRFTALSLDDRGKPIPVMSSDGVLELLLGEPSAARRAELLDTLMRPFPLGLSTEVGLVIANPALSDRPKDYSLFNRQAYHGVQIWGWQETALLEGLERIAAGEAAATARQALDKAGKYAQLEVWTFLPRPDGAVASPVIYASGDEAETDPVQLWSSVPVLKK